MSFIFNEILIWSSAAKIFDIENSSSDRIRRRKKIVFEFTGEVNPEILCKSDDTSRGLNARNRCAFNQYKKVE